MIRDSDGGAIRGYVWGYTSDAPYSVPIGPNNGFIGLTAGQGQPTVFQTGVHHAVFRTGADASTWVLAGTPIAGASAKTCKPTWSGNELSVTTPSGDKLVMLPDTASSIVPAISSNGVAVAELPGSFAVSADGAATYSIPLHVPDGPAGMQPSLSLNYSSRGGDGMLGLGWSLSGFSQISRCPKTIASNGVAKDIQFDDTDDFCLDGEHLRKMTGTDYRPESSPFTRVVPGTQDKGGPTEFVVYLAGGRIRHYGILGNSTLEGQRLQVQANDNDWASPPVESVSTDPARLSWYLASEEDRFGNRILYTYHRSMRCESDAQPCKPIYEIHPEQINYTASRGRYDAARSVTLVYAADRLGAPQPVRYTAGLAVQAPPLLTRVEMLAPNPVQKGLVRSYKLDYGADAVPGGAEQPQAFGTPPGGVRRISAIRECDANDICTRPTTFESAPHPDYDYEDVDTQISFDQEIAKSPFQLSPVAARQLWEMLVGDVDGDGRDDILYRTFPDGDPAQSDGSTKVNWTLRLSSKVSAGLPFGDAKPSGLPPQFAFGGQRPMAPRVADLDGDGRAEVLFPVSKRLSAYAATPKGTQNLDDEGVAAADRSFPYWRIYRWNAASGVLSTDIDHPDPAETNFAGTAADLLYAAPYTQNCLDMAACADGSSLPYQIVWPSPIYLADLNGDGYPDLVRRDLDDARYNSSQHWMYRLNHGGTFAAQYQTLDPKDTTPWMQPVRSAYVANVDRSGRSSLVHEQKGATRLRATSVAISAPATSLTTLPSANSDMDPSHFMFMDVNGDGMGDVLRVPGYGEIPGYPAAQIGLNSGAGFRALTFGGVNPNDDSPIALNATDARAPDSGIRVTDLDEDGLADLVLFGNNWPAINDSDGTTTVSRAQIMGRRSDGSRLSRSAYMFAKLQTGLPGPMPNGHRIDNRGYIFEQLLDANGDGYADLLSVPDINGNAKPTLHLYRRIPRRFGEVATITSGFGVSQSIEYSSPTRADAADCVAPIVCTAKGMRVVSAVTTSVPGNAINGAASRRTTYDYRGPRTNTTGRGWLGFTKSIVTDTSTGAKVTTDYDPTPLVLGKYPYAFLPRKVTSTSNEFGPAYNPGTSGRSYVATSSYDYVLLQPQKYISDVRAAALHTSTTRSFETTPGLPKPLGTGPTTEVLFATSESIGYDGFGNQTSRTTVTGTDPNESETVTVSRQVDNDDKAWLLGMVRSETVTSTLTRGVLGASSASRTVQHTYDSATGALETTTVPATADTEAVGTAFLRDSRGRVTDVLASTAHESRATRVVYDELDGTYPRESSNALGHVTRYAFHAGLGSLVWIQDPNGLVSRLQVDTFGRARRVDSPDGSWNRFGTYLSSEGAFQVQTWASSGASSVVTHDALGRTILTERLMNTGLAGSVWSATATRWNRVFWNLPSFVSIPFEASDFGHLGKLNIVVPASGRTATVDNVGRVVVTSAPGGDVRTRTYAGRSTTDSNSVGGRTVSVLNSQARLAEHRELVDASFGNATPHDVVSTYVYQAFGLVESVSAPAGSLSFTYDSLGRQKRLEDSSNGVTSWGLDGFGNLLNETRGSAGSTDYFHDQLGRTTASNSSLDGVTCFEYDQGTAGIGHITRAYRSAGVNEEQYTYDGASGLLSAIHQVIDGESFDTGIEFQSGLLKSISYPGGDVVISYLYSDVGDVDKVLDGRNPIWALGDRDAAGQLRSATLGNGLADIRTYEPDSFRLQSMTLGMPGASAKLSSAAYSYDSMGRLKTQTIMGAGPEEFQHDTLGRIRSWTSSSPKFGAAYAFDDAGNLRQRAGDAQSSAALTFTPESARASIVGSSSDGIGYVHDDVGRLVRTYGVSDGSDHRVIEYSSFDLPLHITEGGQERATFEYGPRQNRVRKTEPGGVTVYVGGLLEIHRHDGREERVHHAYGPEGLVADIVPTTDGHARSYVFSDRLGSTSVVTDDAGVVAARTRFDPFGSRVRPESPTTLVASNPLEAVTTGFTGHEQEDALGLVNMGGRVYDPRLGRLLSADPMLAGGALGLNRHVYVGGLVLDSVDPSGFEDVPSTTPAIEDEEKRARLGYLFRAADADTANAWHERGGKGAYEEDITTTETPNGEGRTDRSVHRESMSTESAMERIVGAPIVRAQEGIPISGDVRLGTAYGSSGTVRDHYSWSNSGVGAGVGASQDDNGSGGNVDPSWLISAGDNRGILSPWENLNTPKEPAYYSSRKDEEWTKQAMVHVAIFTAMAIPGAIVGALGEAGVAAGGVRGAVEAELGESLAGREFFLHGTTRGAAEGFEWQAGRGLFTTTDPAVARMFAQRAAARVGGGEVGGVAVVLPRAAVAQLRSLGQLAVRPISDMPQHLEWVFGPGAREIVLRQGEIVVLPPAAL